MNHQAELLEQQLMEERAKVAALDAEKARGFVPEGYVVAPEESRALLTNILAELERGFVACQTCGDQEDTKDLDCVADLEFLQRMLAAAPAPAERVEQKPWSAAVNAHKLESGRMTLNIRLFDASKFTEGTNYLYTTPQPSPAPASIRLPSMAKPASDDSASIQGFCSGWNNCLTEVARINEAPAAPDVAGLVDGRSVSIDVSTGDHDAAHRLYGTVIEVAPDGTLLCELDSDNHDYDISPLWLAQAVQVLDAMPKESGHVHPSRKLEIAQSRVIHEARIFVDRISPKKQFCEYAGCCAVSIDDTRLCQDHQEPKP